MTDFAGDIDRLRRSFLDRLDDGPAALGVWRDRARAAYEQVEARETRDAHPEAAGIPEGAPPQYEAVRTRVERGDYTWYDVMSGDVTDPDARRVHVWLDGRIDVIRRAWRELERGADLDEAVAAASGQIERESRARG